MWHEYQAAVIFVLVDLRATDRQTDRQRPVLCVEEGARRGEGTASVLNAAARRYKEMNETHTLSCSSNNTPTPAPAPAATVYIHTAVTVVCSWHDNAAARTHHRPLQYLCQCQLLLSRNCTPNSTLMEHWRISGKTEICDVPCNRSGMAQSKTRD